MKKILIITSVLVILIIGGVFPAEQTKQAENNFLKDWYTFEHITNNDEEYKNYTITKMVNNEKIGNVKQVKNVIKYNVPWALSIILWGDYSVLTYERVLTKSLSLSITPRFISPYDQPHRPHGLGVMLSPRWYPIKTKYTPSGGFVTFPISVLLLSYPHIYEFGGIAASTNIGGGYQWIFRNGFALDIFAHLGVQNTLTSGAREPTYYFGVNLGYAF